MAEYTTTVESVFEANAQPLINILDQIQRKMAILNTSIQKVNIAAGGLNFSALTAANFNPISTGAQTASNAMRGMQTVVETVATGMANYANTVATVANRGKAYIDIVDRMTQGVSNFGQSQEIVRQASEGTGIAFNRLRELFKKYLTDVEQLPSSAKQVEEMRKKYKISLDNLQKDFDTFQIARQKAFAGGDLSGGLKIEGELQKISNKMKEVKAQEAQAIDVATAALKRYQSELKKIGEGVTTGKGGSLMENAVKDYSATGKAGVQQIEEVRQKYTVAIQDINKQLNSFRMAKAAAIAKGDLSGIITAETEIGKLNGRLSESKAQLGNLGKAWDGSVQGLSNYLAQIQKESESFKKFRTELNQNVESINKLNDAKRKSIEQSEKTAAAEDKEAASKRKVAEQSEKTAAAEGKETAARQNGADSAKQKLSMYDNLLKKAKDYAMFMVSSVMVSGTVNALKSGINTIIEYDQSLANLQTVAQGTDSQLALMGDKLKDVSRTTKFSSTEVGEGMTLLAQAGMSMKETGDTITAAARLSTGALEKMDASSDLLTTTLKAFSIDTVESGRVVDVFANACNYSKLTVEKLRTAMAYVGVVAAQSGVSLEDSASSMMLLSDAGMKASTVGTSFREIMSRMVVPNEKMKKSLLENGMAMTDLNPKVVGYENVLKNLSKILWDTNSQTVDMGKASTLFGLRGQSAAAILVKSFSEVKNGTTAWETARKGATEAGSSYRMAATYSEGLGAKLKQVQNQAKLLALALADGGLIPYTATIKMAAGATLEILKWTEKFVSSDWGSMTIKAASFFAIMMKMNSLMPMISAGFATVFTNVTNLSGAASTIKDKFLSLGNINPFVLVTAAAVGLGMAINKALNYNNDMAAASLKTAEVHDQAAQALEVYSKQLGRVGESSMEYGESVKRLKMEQPALVEKIRQAANVTDIASLSYQELAKAMQTVKNKEINDALDSQADALKRLSVETENARKAKANAESGISFSFNPFEDEEERIKKTTKAYKEMESAVSESSNKVVIALRDQVSQQSKTKEEAYAYIDTLKLVPGEADKMKESLKKAFSESSTASKEAAKATLDGIKTVMQGAEKEIESLTTRAKSAQDQIKSINEANTSLDKSYQETLRDLNQKTMSDSDKWEDDRKEAHRLLNEGIANSDKAMLDESAKLFKSLSTTVKDSNGETIHSLSETSDVAKEGISATYEATKKILADQKEKAGKELSDIETNMASLEKKIGDYQQKIASASKENLKLDTSEADASLDRMITKMETLRAGVSSGKFESPSEGSPEKVAVAAAPKVTPEIDTANFDKAEKEMKSFEGDMNNMSAKAVVGVDIEASAAEPFTEKLPKLKKMMDEFGQDISSLDSKAVVSVTDGKGEPLSDSVAALRSLLDNFSKETSAINAKIEVQFEGEDGSPLTEEINAFPARLDNLKKTIEELKTKFNVKIDVNFDEVKDSFNKKWEDLSEEQEIFLKPAIDLKSVAESLKKLEMDTGQFAGVDIQITSDGQLIEKRITNVEFYLKNLSNFIKNTNEKIQLSVVASTNETGEMALESLPDHISVLLDKVKEKTSRLRADFGINFTDENGGQFTPASVDKFVKELIKGTEDEEAGRIDLKVGVNGKEIDTYIAEIKKQTPEIVIDFKGRNDSVKPLTEKVADMKSLIAAFSKEVDDFNAKIEVQFEGEDGSPLTEEIKEIDGKIAEFKQKASSFKAEFGIDIKTNISDDMPENIKKYIKGDEGALSDNPDAEIFVKIEPDTESIKRLEEVTKQTVSLKIDSKAKDDLKALADEADNVNDRISNMFEGDVSAKGIATISKDIDALGEHISDVSKGFNLKITGEDGKPINEYLASVKDAMSQNLEGDVPEISFKVNGKDVDNVISLLDGYKAKPAEVSVQPKVELSAIEKTKQTLLDLNREFKEMLSSGIDFVVNFLGSGSDTKPLSHKVKEMKEHTSSFGDHVKSSGQHEVKVKFKGEDKDTDHYSVVVHSAEEKIKSFEKAAKEAKPYVKVKVDSGDTEQAKDRIEKVTKAADGSNTTILESSKKANNEYIIERSKFWAMNADLAKKKGIDLVKLEEDANTAKKELYGKDVAAKKEANDEITEADFALFEDEEKIEGETVKKKSLDKSLTDLKKHNSEIEQIDQKTAEARKKIIENGVNAVADGSKKELFAKKEVAIQISEIETEAAKKVESDTKPSPAIEQTKTQITDIKAMLSEDMKVNIQAVKSDEDLKALTEKLKAIKEETGKDYSINIGKISGDVNMDEILAKVRTLKTAMGENAKFTVNMTGKASSEMPLIEKIAEVSDTFNTLKSWIDSVSATFSVNIATDNDVPLIEELDVARDNLSSLQDFLDSADAEFKISFTDNDGNPMSDTIIDMSDKITEIMDAVSQTATFEIETKESVEGVSSLADIVNNTFKLLTAKQEITIDTSSAEKKIAELTEKARTLKKELSSASSGSSGSSGSGDSGGGDAPKEFAAGGHVPGTGTGDTVRALLTPREFVQPVDAVDHAGLPFMEFIRRRMISREAIDLLMQSGVQRLRGIKERFSNITFSVPEMRLPAFRPQMVQAFAQGGPVFNSNGAPPQNMGSLTLNLGGVSGEIQGEEKFIKALMQQVKKEQSMGYGRSKR